MPRISKLVQLQPNRVYSIQGTVKYKHSTEGFTTLIIEQDQIQKKIKIPQSDLEVRQGRGYKFGNCFYNSQGWLKARKPNQTIQPIQVQNESIESVSISLQQIKQNLQFFTGKYLTTCLNIISIQPQQVITKNEKQIKLKILKGYYKNYLVDLTMWNLQLNDQQLINKNVLFQGVRIKKITDQKFILVSTVFTKITPLENIIQDKLQQNKINYINLSQIYQKRTLQNLINIGIPQKKQFSIIKAKIKSIIKAEYKGCPKCKRKIENNCQICNIKESINYSYGKVILEDKDVAIQVIVFDEKICQLFKFAKENCFIEGRIKTFARIQQDQNVISHILTKIDSIFF